MSYIYCIFARSWTSTWLSTSLQKFRYFVVHERELIIINLIIFRSLEHSTIIYETPEGSVPLLRLSWNKQDPNYLATMMMDNSKAIIIDIRYVDIHTIIFNALRVDPANWTRVRISFYGNIFCVTFRRPPIHLAKRILCYHKRYQYYFWVCIG
jgi:hypothetical protein